jgi:hypothetical protein
VNWRIPIHRAAVLAPAFSSLAMRQHHSASVTRLACLTLEYAPRALMPNGMAVVALPVGRALGQEIIIRWLELLDLL